jgi:hypothetical protein
MLLSLRWWIASFVVWCGVSTLLSVASVHEAAPQAKAPESFDIVSLRLYMTGDEAIAALRTRFKINPATDLIVGKRPGTYAPKATFIPYVQYRTNAFSLKIEFAEVFPLSQGKREGAYRISYAMSTKTTADVDAMKQKAQEKYGAPTTNGPAGSDVWCDTPCDVLMKPQLEAGPMFDGGFLVYLHDEGFRKRMEEAFNKTKTGAAPL